MIGENPKAHCIDSTSFKLSSTDVQLLQPGDSEAFYCHEARASQ